VDRIRVGQIGVCHEHAAGKIATLRRMSDIFEIVGVADDRATSLTPRFAGDNLEPYEGLTLMTEELLLATPGLQAVTVEVPNLDLVPAALRCMKRNLAVHMDKPGGDDIDAFVRMRRGVEARNLPFQMGYMFRGNPAFRWCIGAVREGWLGEVFEIQANMSHDYGGDAYQAYLGQFRGGIMFNLGCHLLDAVVAMMGAPTLVTPFLKAAPGDHARISNNCLAVLEYPRAIVALRACSKEVDGIARRSLKICGTNGSVELCPLERFDGKPLTLRLVLRQAAGGYGAGTHTIDFGIVADRYEAQLMEFARTIRGEIQNPYGADHDCLVQEVLLAASGYISWQADNTN